jgi:2-oxoisovalerate dehydrogenase E1 component beta subunit
MALKTLIESVREALYEEMQRDERVIVLGEDVGLHGGVFRATDGLQKEFGAERVIDTPLAELGIAGVAIGAALNGLRPVAEIQFADYIHPAYDQIVNEAAKIRYRSNGSFECPVVFRAPFGAGVHGGLYHSQSVEALFFHVPGLKIVVPATPYDCKGLLKSAIRDDDPVLFFEHKKSYRRVRGEVPDLRTLLPLDKPAIRESVKKTSKVLILHEDNKTGGIGAEVAALIAEELFEWLDGPIYRIAAADTHIPYAPPLEEAILPHTEDVIRAARELAAY